MSKLYDQEQFALYYSYSVVFCHYWNSLQFTNILYYKYIYENPTKLSIKIFLYFTTIFDIAAFQRLIFTISMLSPYYFKLCTLNMTSGLIPSIGFHIRFWTRNWFVEWIRTILFWRSKAHVLLFLHWTDSAGTAHTIALVMFWKKFANFWNYLETLGLLNLYLTCYLVVTSKFFVILFPNLIILLGELFYTHSIGLKCHILNSRQNFVWLF